MKSLQESLFDQDIEKQDVETGELYKLSTDAHHNSFSNNPIKFMEVFDVKKLMKIKHQFVDTDNNFISYYETGNRAITATRLTGLSALINCILCAPAETFGYSNNVDCEKVLKQYLKPYVKSKYFTDLYIGIRRFNMHGDKQAMIEIVIWDNIRDSRSNSMLIMLVRK